MAEKVEDVQGEAHKKMDGAVEHFRKELGTLRAGRASTDMLTPVMVEYYGTPTPLNQLATLNTPDPQLITVTPFDRSTTKAIEKAIAAADLGLNPSSDGHTIRVPIPVMTEERRKELSKHVKKLGEETKVAVRNIRRDANDKLKKLEKDKAISQDEEHMAFDKIQTETDQHIKNIDELVKKKEQELMTV